MSSNTRSSKGASKAATATTGKRGSKVVKIADLNEEERKKYDDAIQSALRLEEEKADLNEQCDAKDEQITRFQRELEEELDKGSANATRLTEIITALEDQRVEAFELLQVYQQRIEQLSETIRKYEKDEMGGERKKTMLASIASLEELVESQKSTIHSHGLEHATLVESHKGELGVVQKLADQQNKEIEEKRAALDRTEKRCAAIEMACARLTKQISEMHRRDGVKSAEIEALKKLLTEKVVLTEESKEKDQHHHVHHHAAKQAPPPTYDRDGHLHVPQHTKHRLATSHVHIGTVSPKRKLSDALETGRGGTVRAPFQKDRDNEDFLVAVDKDTGKNPVATKRTPQQQAVAGKRRNSAKAASPGPKEARLKKRPGGGDAGGTGSRLTRSETKSRVLEEAAKVKEREISAEQEHQAEVLRRKQAREKNARLRDVKAVDILSQSPSPARRARASEGAKRRKGDSKDNDEKKIKGKNASVTAGAPVIDARTAMSVEGGVSVVKQGTLTKKVSTSAIRGRDKDRNGSVKTPLKVVLGERKQYDPALFALVSSLDP